MHKRILLVEDDAATRSGLSMLLERAGYDVIATTGVPEGQRVLDEAPPDLLIADVRLGAFNRLQLLAMASGTFPPSLLRDFLTQCWRPRLDSWARPFS
jgi:DNA-binding response OmpR family regulator